MDKYELLADFEDDGVGGAYWILAHSHREAIEHTLRRLGKVPDRIEARNTVTQKRVIYEHGEYTNVTDIPSVMSRRVRVGDDIDVDFGERPLKVDEGTHKLTSHWRGYTVTGYELVVNEKQEVQSVKLILEARTVLSPPDSYRIPRMTIPEDDDEDDYEDQG